MPNMTKFLSKHNSQISRPNRPTQTRTSMCNCNKKDECPLPGRCLTDKVVYTATVTDENDNVENYTGLTCKTFKERHYKHKNSFKYQNSDNSTTLSSNVWGLNDRGLPYSIELDMIDRAPPFNLNSRKSRLCLKEKYHIMFSRDVASLNLRSEMFNTRRNGLKGLLVNV